MSLPRYYTILVDRVDKAIAALDEFNHIKARELLIEGLQAAEDEYINTPEEKLLADMERDSDVDINVISKVRETHALVKSLTSYERMFIISVLSNAAIEALDDLGV